MRDIRVVLSGMDDVIKANNCFILNNSQVAKNIHIDMMSLKDTLMYSPPEWFSGTRSVWFFQRLENIVNLHLPREVVDNNPWSREVITIFTDPNYGLPGTDPEITDSE